MSGSASASMDSFPSGPKCELPPAIATAERRPFSYPTNAPPHLGANRIAPQHALLKDAVEPFGEAPGLSGSDSYWHREIGRSKRSAPDSGGFPERPCA